MGMECGECERDLRGGHDASCSRYKPQVCPVCCDSLEDGDGYMWCKKHGEVDPLTNKAAIGEIARLTALVSSSERERVRSCSELLERAIAAEAERDTARAETAMAFEVAGDVAAVRCAACGVREIANLVKEHVKRSVPADATAALAARDKATREKALRDAAAIAQKNRESWLCAAGFEGFATGAKIISDAILSLIQEENQ